MGARGKRERETENSAVESHPFPTLSLVLAELKACIIDSNSSPLPPDLPFIWLGRETQRCLTIGKRVLLSRRASPLRRRMSTGDTRTCRCWCRSSARLGC